MQDIEARLDRIEAMLTADAERQEAIAKRLEKAIAALSTKIDTNTDKIYWTVVNK